MKSRSRFLVAIALATLLVASGFSPPDRGFPLEGEWHGTLVTGQVDLPLVLHISRNEDDTFKATLDSPAQQAFGIAMDTVEIDGHKIRIWSSQLQGGFTTEVSDEKPDEMDGAWEQGGMSLPLKVTRHIADS